MTKYPKTIVSINCSPYNAHKGEQNSVKKIISFIMASFVLVSALIIPVKAAGRDQYYYINILLNSFKAWGSYTDGSDTHYVTALQARSAHLNPTSYWVKGIMRY